jgi:hypothetical protein
MATSAPEASGNHLAGVDINGDGTANSQDQIPTGNVGWVVDLPGLIDLDGDGQDNDLDTYVDEDDDFDGEIDERMPGERVINDAIIRDGKAILISFGVTGTRCNAGAYSFVNERNPNTGGALGQPVIDLTNDREVDPEDQVYVRVPYDVDGDGDIDGDDVIAGAPTDKAFEGRLYNPAILREDDDPDSGGDDDPEEIKYFSSSAGGIQIIVEKGERRGIYSWQQVE